MSSDDDNDPSGSATPHAPRPHVRTAGPTVATSTTTAAVSNTGAGAATSGDAGSNPQRLRLYVPTGESEHTLGLANDAHLGVRSRTRFNVSRFDGSVGVSTTLALGVNDKGFVGVLGVADHGNIFLCATGQADVGTSYASANRVGIIVETGVNVVRNMLQLWGSHYHKGQASGLATVFGIGQTALAIFNAATSPLSGSGSSGFTNTDYLQTGHVGVFGARTVKLESIESIASSSALFNSHSAGLAASLNSIVSASVNSGILSDLKAGYGASVTAQSANVIGGVDAGLSARVGTTRVEGQSIRIGNRKQAGMKSQYLSGIQEQTEDLWLRAHSMIDIGVPSANQPPETPADWGLDGHLIGMQMHPNGMQIMRGSVRLSSNKAALRLAADATTIAGRSLIRVGNSAVEIGRLLMPVHATTSAQLDAARIAYNTAWGASEGIVKQLEAVFSNLTAKGVAATIGTVGLVAGVGAAGGATAGAIGDKTNKAAEIGAITGATVGAAGALTALLLTSMKAAGKIQRAGQKAAQKAYALAARLALLNETPLTVLDPSSPKIQVKDGKIVLAVGPMASITISEDSIKIAGLSVTINDMEMGPGIPPPPPPPIVPDVDPPPVDPGGPSAEDSVLASMLAEAGF